MSDVKNPLVTITMADGRVMTGELYPDKAPNTVANFISLAIPLARQGLFLIPLAAVLSSRCGMDGALLAAPVSDVLTFLLCLILVRREFRSWRRLGRLA